ncbi:MAG: hypothetical protein L0Y66_01205, partial [Myxococcaceae bacterium]|nr:hypothetical protein [Myxococcaceae bacterium]
TSTSTSTSTSTFTFEEGGADEPASEELDEAEFFLEQGLHEEALEVLETVAIAFPGHRRAARLRARLESLQSGGASFEAPPPLPKAPTWSAPTRSAPPPPAPPMRAPTTDALDLADELAGDFDALAEASPQTSTDEFQYSVEEVFNEFKKGLEKVVKPEDVDTHYDLGIAYKEMGLIDDAISEFLVARKGCVGKKKEVDCLTMVGLLQRDRGEHGAAVAAFKDALVTEHATGETQKALLFELATTWEAMGRPGKALFHFQRVAQADGAYREVAGIVSRLTLVTAPEPDELPRKPGTGSPVSPPRPGGAPSARKVGYV